MGAEDVALDAGWGRLVFAQTFADEAGVLACLRDEQPGRRDIAMYVAYPQVLLGLAPSELFVDPSVTYRLGLDGPSPPPPPVRVRPLDGPADVDAMNRIAAVNGMVRAHAAQVLANAAGDVFTYLVAVDAAGTVLGSVTGVDHVAAFGDRDGGSSLWALAVDPQAAVPGVGRALTLALAAVFRARGRAWMDLSVLHDNTAAIRLYEQLGFVRTPVFAVKRKNPINEKLFTAPMEADGLNPYARIVADEAARRGISVRILDAAWGELELTHAGRRVLTRESLSELTSAVAMSRCEPASRCRS